MAKLILTLDGVQLKEYTLTKERTTIGRKAHNDVQIDNLAVSGEHAAIVTILNDSFLEDLGSTNGTLVNGQPVKKHFLQSNDVIEIGKYKLKYVSEAPAMATAADFEKTMVLRAPPKAPATPAPAAAAATVTQGVATTQGGGLARALSETEIPVQGRTTAEPAPGAAPAAPAQPDALPDAPAPSVAREPAATAPTPQAAPPAGSQAVIQILSGPNAGKELTLAKALTTLGKPGVQVAVIARRPQGFFLTHVEGASFPVVNGKALDAQAHLLHDHDIVELAGVKMEFYLRPGA
jgi:predicted component of type VI protein secretion system